MGDFQSDPKDASAPKLGASAICAALDRSGVAAKEIDKMLIGRELFEETG